MRHTSHRARIGICLAAAVAVSSAVLLSRAESPTTRNHPAPAPVAETPPAVPAPDISLQPAPGVEAAEVVSAVKPDVVATDPAPPNAPGAFGMMVGVDPETGRIGKPSAEVRQRLEATLPDPALDRSMDGIDIVHRPDGSMMADLKGRFQDYTVIRITPDGRKIESCVQGPQVETALQADEKPAPAPQHEVR